MVILFLSSLCSTTALGLHIDIDVIKHLYYTYCNSLHFVNFFSFRVGQVLLDVDGLAINISDHCANLSGHRIGAFK